MCTFIYGVCKMIDFINYFGIIRIFLNERGTEIFLGLMEIDVAFFEFPHKFFFYFFLFWNQRMFRNDIPGKFNAEINLKNG